MGKNKGGGGGGGGGSGGGGANVRYIRWFFDWQTKIKQKVTL